MIKDRIHKAYSFSQEKHKGQMRKNSGLEYFSHPKYVARIVEELIDDETLIVASLLHDTVEDTDTTIEEIETNFGGEIASIVDELTNKPEERGNMKKKDYILLKMSKMSDSALIVKLADRLHNVLFLESDFCDDFLRYYYRNTRFILENLEERRKEEGGSLNQLHITLLEKISIVLDFLKIRHKL